MGQAELWPKSPICLPPLSLPLLNKKGIRRIQSINGTFLYYGRAVDPYILPSCNKIGTQQASPTSKTTSAINMFMDYMATYPDTVIRYYASNTYLHIDSDAAYLVFPKVRTRGADHFFLSNTPPKSNT